MKPSDVEIAVARGIVKGGLVLLLVALVLWLLSPLLIPLLVAWGLYLYDSLLDASWRDLKGVLVSFGVLLAVWGVQVLMAYKRIWIYSDKTPTSGWRFYAAVCIAVLFNFLLVFLAIAFAVYVLR